MDQGPPEAKRPRLSTGSSWSAGGPHLGVSILHPTTSPTTGQFPHHPTPPTHYPQPSHLSFARPAGPADAHPPPQPPPPPPPHPHPHPPAAAAHTPLHDRRQHEPDRFPPMQEHRQPSHSPALPPFPPYGPREPMIKTDPADDTLSQLRRPPSTGSNVPDSMTPVTPHSALPPHSQPYGEDRRHVSFDNGPQPPMYSRQPSYQPQTPLPPPQPYDYPPQYASHGELPYPIQVAAASGKRKAQRASQACDMCRQLKAKCDELKPCKSCKDKNVECKYREAVPKQQDKIAADILDTVVALRSEFGEFRQRLSKLEHAVKRIAPSVDLQPGPLDPEEERPESADSAAAPLAEDAYSSSPGDTAAGTQAPIGTLEEARAITRNMEEEKEVEPGPVVRPGVPSIPPNHTTLAAFLLKWPPIQALVRGILESENIKYVDEFPIRQEERRGLLRVWGRGEGLDSSRIDREAVRDVGVLEVQDDVSESGAPSPADCWGGISGSPGPVEGKSVIAVLTPDFSESTVWKYVKSFQDNIQIMHPLIIPVELNAMVKLFLDSIHQSLKQNRSAGIAKFVSTPASQSETGSKRKRSPGPDGAESPSLPKPARPSFQRSINNALVLLVLALGKICLHKDKIPDVVPVSEPSHGSPLARNGYPASPVQGSSPSHGSRSHSAGLPSPKEGAERPGPSRRSSFGPGPSARAGTSLKRNLDVIPGLEYFAYATDILGGQLAGTSLRHIHAYLLAGLYHGQLGRVLESYAYIKEAGYALQVKMRPSLDRFRKLRENMHVEQHALAEKSDNQLVFAFWTCLQLESDIIAELPLPQSHILAYEEMMPYPNTNLAREHGFDERVLQSYLAQLYLRKSLNKIHGMLYNPENPPPIQTPSGGPGGNIIEYIETLLDMRFVPPEFKFNLNDPPAKDLLSARLRAKYWGAQMITYRPFIRQIIESNFNKSMSSESPPITAAAGGFRSGIAVSPAGPDAPPTDGIPQEMIPYAMKGIRALVESTRAFHGLKEKRYVVTNIFGTAHAQWGNLVTLAAVFRDPALRSFVDERTLRELFSRTIAFFKVIALPTSALHVDLRILEGLERELWGKQQPNNSADVSDHPTGSSYSSSASGGAPTPAQQPLVVSPIPPVPLMAAPAAAAAAAAALPGPAAGVNNHHHHHHVVVDVGGGGGGATMSAVLSPATTLPPPLPAMMPGPVAFPAAAPGTLLPPTQPQPPLR